MERTHATVVLEIFSGRPDPSWTLDEHHVTELLRRLKTLPPATEHTLPPEPGLGYRGLHVSLSDGAHGETVVVRQGRVAFGRRILQDRGRTLEHWLLDTPPPDLEPAVLRSVKAAL
jgi:hypothetical protein